MRCLIACRSKEKVAEGEVENEGESLGQNVARI